MMRIAAQSVAAAVIVASFAAMPRASAADARRLEAPQAQALEPTRVLVHRTWLTEEEIEDLEQHPADLSVLATGGVTLGVVGTNAGVTVAATTGQAGVASAGAMVAPLALVAGIGAIVGSVQQSGQQRDEALALTATLRRGFADAHEREELDRRFCAALAVELARISWFETRGEVGMQKQEPQGVRPSPVREPYKKLLRAIPEGDGDSVLIVNVRSGLSPTLSGMFVVADARLYSGAALESVGGRRKDWRKRPVFVAERRAIVLTPIPVADLFKKPEAWVAEHRGEVQQRYEVLLDKQSDRDMRRVLRTRRNAELERVEGPWLPPQLAAYMVAAWQDGSGDRYQEVVGSGFMQLAQALATELSTLAPAAGAAAPVAAR